MIKYCLDKWNRNSKRLEKVLATDTKLNRCNYEYLVELVVKHILNDDDPDDNYEWSAKGITEIDNGNYQGTLLYLIPRATYQPSEYDYLMTYVYYGSCGGCDTLQSIQNWSDSVMNAKQLGDFMILCKDLVDNMTRPYNSGWRNDPRFEEVRYE